MKTLKTLLFLGLLLAGPSLFAQSKSLVYIHIQENIQSASSYMRITYPDQSSKNIELTKLQLTGKGAEENGKIIQKELSKLINDGYSIISCAVGSDIYVATTKILLVKEE